MESNPVHKNIHQKGDSREISNVFEDGETDEKWDEVREDNGNASCNPL
jgi:hypothetical protein